MYFDNDSGKSIQELVDDARKVSKTMKMVGSPLILTRLKGSIEVVVFMRIGTCGELIPEDLAQLHPDEIVEFRTQDQKEILGKMLRLGDLDVYKKAVANNKK